MGQTCYIIFDVREPVKNDSPSNQDDYLPTGNEHDPETHGIPPPL